MQNSTENKIHSHQTSSGTGTMSKPTQTDECFNEKLKDHRTKVLEIMQMERLILIYTNESSTYSLSLLLLLCCCFFMAFDAQCDEVILNHIWLSFHTPSAILFVVLLLNNFKYFDLLEFHLQSSRSHLILWKICKS